MAWVELIWKMIFAIEVREQGGYDRKEEKATKDWVTDLIKSVGNWNPSPMKPSKEPVEEISEMSHHMKWK